MMSLTVAKSHFSYLVGGGFGALLALFSVFWHLLKRIYTDLWCPVANVRNDHGKDALQLTPRMEHVQSAYACACFVDVLS